MPPDGLICFCDACGPSGAPQSKATLSIHSKRQKARTHTVRYTGENSLSAVGADDRYQVPPIPTATSLRSEADGCARTEPGIGSTMETSQIEMISTDLTRRLSRFKPPNVLTFRYPPTTPTAMYPGSGGMNAPWDVGPAALLPTNKCNASILLHVSYLQSISAVLTQSQDSTGIDSRTKRLVEIVSRNLQNLEHWRMSQWIRCQRCAPDPDRIGPRRYMTGM